MSDVEIIEVHGRSALRLTGEAAALAVQLAELTGKTPTEALTAALSERLAREREIRERHQRIQEIAAQIRGGMKEPASSADHNELYGEDGLPK